VDDENPGKLAGAAGRSHQVATHLPLALGRLVLDSARLEAAIVARDLLGLGEARAQRLEEHRGGHSADRELGRLLEETAAIDVAVHVLVEEVEELLIEIGWGLPTHVATSGVACNICGGAALRRRRPRDQSRQQTSEGESARPVNRAPLGHGEPARPRHHSWYSRGRDARSRSDDDHESDDPGSDHPLGAPL
jgi:hypothetical protein